MLWCFHLYFNFVATCFWVELYRLRPSGLFMNESNINLRVLFFISLFFISHLFTIVAAQHIEKSADSVIHPANHLIQPVDTSNNQEYEIVYDTLYVPGDTIHNTDTLVVYIKNKIPLMYSIDFSLSAFYSFADIGTHSENYIEYAYKRQKAQTPLLSYQMGANFNIQKNNHSIGLGLGIIDFREVQNYSDSWAQKTTTYSKLDTIDTYYVVKGNDTSLQYVTKENQYSKIDSSLKKNSYKNHYLYFEIPVIYSYKIDFKKISLSLRTGLLLDFLLNVSGKTMSDNNFNEFTSISKTKDFRNFNISLCLGAAILYPLNNRLHIIFEPFYIKGFSSVYYSDYAIFQKQHSYGIRCGLHYLL